jgi:hypothetical protein
MRLEERACNEFPFKDGTAFHPPKPGSLAHYRTTRDDNATSHRMRRNTHKVLILDYRMLMR